MPARVRAAYDLAFEHAMSRTHSVAGATLSHPAPEYQRIAADVSRLLRTFNPENCRKKPKSLLRRFFSLCLPSGLAMIRSRPLGPASRR